MKLDTRVQQVRSFRCRSVLRFIGIVMGILLAAPFAGAQSTSGRIRGTILDTSGSAVAAAKITLINQATNVSRDLQSGANGEYIFIEVPVGTYEIDVTQAGFKKFIRKDITLNLNEVISVDITLQVGAATESIEVTGAPPVVDTNSRKPCRIAQDEIRAGKVKWVIPEAPKPAVQAAGQVLEPGTPTDS